MKHVTVTAFKEIIEAEKHNPSVDFINVCTPAEYKEKHIRGVRSVPLDSLQSHLSEFTSKKTIYIHCRSGKRGMAAIERLKDLGIEAELINVEGGILAWEEAGHETGSHTTRIPIIRQVFIVAAVLILIGTFLGFTVHKAYFLLPFLVGCGLMFSGITGWCSMALLLAKMPWNR